MRFSIFLFALSLLTFCGCDSSSTQSSEQKQGVESSVTTKKTVSKNEKKITREDTIAVFQIEYEKWLAAAIASGEFCSAETCWEERENFEKDMDHVIECMVGLPDKPEYLVGELNGDGTLDAVAEADWTQCDGGNALHTAKTWLVFLSEADGSYTTIEDPGAFGSMEIGGIYEIKDGIIYAQGLAYHDDDPRCCPSISWDLEYQVVSDPSKSSALSALVVETAISEKVREEVE